MPVAIVNFMFKWQELVGAALGPFLAIMLAGIGYWIKSWIGSRAELREHLRQCEISTSRSINDLYDAREELKGFVERLNTVIASIRGTTNPSAYCLQDTNFAPLTDVFRDASLPAGKIRSYYLHNKILFLDAGLKNINSSIEKLRLEYDNLRKKNELMVTLKAPPLEQRETYAANLESFASLIGKFTQYVDSGIRTIVQTKVYLSKQRQNKRWFIWKHEGRSFKFYLSRKSMDKFHRHLDAIDRIDEVLKTEVNALLKETERRAEEKYRNA
ncbi:hypothetical protein JNK62_02955 [bacterium]|nr:hypothetical protein [bacterium]